jgi:hypothetical protein
MVKLCLHDVGSLRTFGSLNNVELDILPFFEGLESISLESRIMNKDIFSAFETDKSEAFPIVEPFDSALAFHTILLF